MAKTFVAHSDGKVLIPDDPVKLPRGSRFRVTLQLLEEADQRGFPLLDLAVKLSRKMKGKYPRDLARNHDHYLHGRPLKDRPAGAR